jgi:Uma2 family endonuclease
MGKRARPAHRWTFPEYQRLIASGFFFKCRVELLGGRIIDMARQSPHHAVGIGLTQRVLEKSFGRHFWPWVLSPLCVDRWTLCKPDLAVVPGEPNDYVATGHPTSALLVIEISDTTLGYDRRRKGPRYARAGYADYWIVNLIDACVEVYRKPMADPSARLGWRYSDVSIHKAGESLQPLAAAKPISIADLLPVLPK